MTPTEDKHDWYFSLDELSALLESPEITPTEQALAMDALSLHALLISTEMTLTSTRSTLAQALATNLRLREKLKAQK